MFLLKAVFDLNVVNTKAMNYFNHGNLYLNTKIALLRRRKDVQLIIEIFYSTKEGLYRRCVVIHSLYFKVASSHFQYLLFNERIQLKNIFSNDQTFIFFKPLKKSMQQTNLLIERS